MSKEQETENAVKKALHRWIANPTEYATARSLRLPDDKQCFPKVVVLDLNHWIALARVHHGKSQDGAAMRALEALRQAVASGRLLVPVLDLNMSEASGSKDESRRRRLATFMIELSRNYTLESHVIVTPWELERTIAANYLLACETSGIRSRLLRWGVNPSARKKFAVPENPKWEAAINEVFDYPELSLVGIVHALASVDRSKLNADEAAVMQRAEQIRALDFGMDADAHRRLELTNLGKLLLPQTLQAMGISAAAFERWLLDAGNIDRFWRSVPGVDVLMTLMMTRNRNPDAKAHRNDGRDWSLLRVAIPYANIVVGEVLWSHIANAAGLADRHRTPVTANLDNLPDLLREAGCI